MVGFLGESAPLQKQQHAFAVVGFACGEDLLDKGTDVAPDLLPNLSDRLGEALRMFDAQGRSVGIVVEVSELRPPPHPHLVAGGEHHPHDGAQALRPRVRRTQRRGAPFEIAQQGGDLAGPYEDLVVRVKFGFSARSRGFYSQASDPPQKIQRSSDT